MATRISGRFAPPPPPHVDLPTSARPQIVDDDGFELSDEQVAAKDEGRDVKEEEEEIEVEVVEEEEEEVEDDDEEEDGAEADDEAIEVDVEVEEEEVVTEAPEAVETRHPLLGVSER